jgi:hypothetical protein
MVATETEITNPFGDVDDSEYERLKADIALRGQLVPIEYDQDGRVVDGYTRLRICEELGIEPLIVVRTFTDDRERILHSIALNTLRRQLSPKRKQHWIHEYEQLTLGVVVEEVPRGKPTHWNPTEAPVHATERQRFHRLKEKLRPKHAVAEGTDPFQLASDILDALDAIRPNLGGRHQPDLDAIAEMTRQLVWGPEA